MARSIAAVIGATDRKNGYLQGNSYIVTWCVGHLAGYTKPMKRLWISSMEDSAIREGFVNLKPGRDYDPLHQSALCRAKADWLIGINATRLFSVLYHKTLTVGRVQTPTLKMLVDRDAKISGFQKEKYHIVHIAGSGVEAASDRFHDPAEAEGIKTVCAGAQAVCASIQREKKIEQPPKLYDLTTLQREANRLFGFTAKQTLDYAQTLYEKRLLTYPRTDSRFLTDDMEQTAASIVADLVPMLAFMEGAAFSAEIRCVLNNAKVSDHHAIIPPSHTPKIPCCRLWSGPGPRICPTTPSARGWGRPPLVPPFWKSWYRPALSSARASSFFPPRTASTWRWYGLRPSCALRGAPPGLSFPAQYIPADANGGLCIGRSCADALGGLGAVGHQQAAPMHWGAWGPSATNKLRRVYTGALLAITISIYK